MANSAHGDKKWIAINAAGQLRAVVDAWLAIRCTDYSDRGRLDVRVDDVQALMERALAYEVDAWLNAHASAVDSRYSHKLPQ